MYTMNRSQAKAMASVLDNLAESVDAGETICISVGSHHTVLVVEPNESSPRFEIDIYGGVTER